MAPPFSRGVSMMRIMASGSILPLSASHREIRLARRVSPSQEAASDGTAEFLVYDKEKTVADILSYRNKIGIEETKEIITNYLSLPDRNLNQLHRYAEILGCNKILSTYLEVLL